MTRNLTKVSYIAHILLQISSPEMDTWLLVPTVEKFESLNHICAKKYYLNYNFPQSSSYLKTLCFIRFHEGLRCLLKYVNINIGKTR